MVARCYRKTNSSLQKSGRGEIERERKKKREGERER
jgi:hypothetical protein